MARGKKRVSAPPARTTRDAAPAAPAQGPSEDDIRLLAYYRYLARGAEPASPVDDWLFAERTLGAPAP